MMLDGDWSKKTYQGPHQVSGWHDYLTEEPFILADKVFLQLIATNIDFRSPYQQSNRFLTALVYIARVSEWKDLRRYIISIKWKLQLNEKLRKNASSSRDKLEHTIITNPLVPVTERPEFMYDPDLHNSISNHSVNTTSDFKYKSVGNIFWNATQWISKRCCNYSGNGLLEFEFCVNITPQVTS